MKLNNKGFGIIAILLVLVGVLAVGGGAYYVGKNFKTVPPVNVEENNLEENNQQIVNNVKEDCLPNTAPWIKVLSPNGGEVYQIGQSIVLKWKSCNLNSNVSGELVGISDPDNSKSLFGEGEGGDSNNDQYTINLGPIPSTGVQWINPGTYKFLIRKFNGNTLVDSSDNFFTINLNKKELPSLKSMTEDQILKEIQSWKSSIPIFVGDFVNFLDGKKLFAIPNGWVADTVIVNGIKINITYPSPKQTITPNDYIAIHFPTSLIKNLKTTKCIGNSEVSSCLIGNNSNTEWYFDVMWYFH